MRVLIIDPAKREIREERAPHARDQIAEFGRWARATLNGFFCVGGRLPNGDILLVDDEGLLKFPRAPAFRIPSVTTGTLVGTGILVGNDPPEDWTDARSSLEELAPLVAWHEGPVAVPPIQVIAVDHKGSATVTTIPIKSRA
jgi:hypothetical protein